MRLMDCDIKTREVLEWRGVHLFNGWGSSCSQKVRIYLNLKGIPWTSHPVDLKENENFTDYYLGINPRGLVPCLVHDGAVHIESNEIMEYLETCFPEPPLVPSAHRDSVDALLRHEDDLHLALRTVTFRFMMSADKPPKSAESLLAYEKGGSGTVGGVDDSAKASEIAFWTSVIENGITDDSARTAVTAFRQALDDLERRLTKNQFIFGNALSVLDIAWLVYVNRLMLAGYPISRLHPMVSRWAERLKANPAFSSEIAMPPAMADVVAKNQAMLVTGGKSLPEVCGLI